MLELIDKKQLLAILKISEDTYKKAINPKHDLYVPDFPKPVRLFTGNKHRYSVIDVEHFIKKYSHTIASNDHQQQKAG